MSRPHAAKSTVFFARPFRLPSLDEVLPAGEYALEVTAAPAPDGTGSTPATVLIHLHRSEDAPGLKRTLTVPLTDLCQVLSEDLLSERAAAGRLLENLLADPMVQLVMASDGLTADDMRRAHLGPSSKPDEE